MIELLGDIPRLHTALAEWLACLVYLSQEPQRVRGKRFWMAALAVLAVQMLFLQLTDNVPLLFWMPCMGVAVALMQLFLQLAGRTEFAQASYQCMRAFVLAEFAAALEWQTYAFLVVQGIGPGLWMQLGCMLGCYGLVFGFMYRLEGRTSLAEIHSAVTPRELGGAVIIVLTAFFVSNLSYAYADTGFSSPFLLDIFNTRTLVDLGGVAVLYAYHLQRRELQMRYELDSIQNVLQNQYVQYRQSRDTIEVIDRKYHDLKHQIAALRAEQDPQRRNAWLDEMEQDIKAYEAQNKTGNPVLDTVLTGKSLYCQKHGIALTCVADGSLLDFLDVRDICTIFGNALDNAIECELTIPDKNCRLIHVTVSAQKAFLLLRFENYCKDRRQFEQGLPITTKQDKNYHGFGLKSIRYTAAKYGGSVKVEQQEDWFVVKVLIPLPESDNNTAKST